MSAMAISATEFVADYFLFADDPLISVVIFPETICGSIRRYGVS